MISFDDVLVYVLFCKFINVTKLATRFDIKEEEAFQLIDRLLEEGYIEPTVTHDFKVCVHSLREEE